MDILAGPPFPLNLAPCLLVSIRDVTELHVAASRADIIDIKEPSRGPLGMADPSTIAVISQEMSLLSPVRGLSVAMGELKDWSAIRQAPAFPRQVRWAKIGLAGERDSADWQPRWMALRDQTERNSERRIEWIAVAYADDVAAQSPPISEVLRAAVETRCSGLLIDTATKSGGGLPEWLPPSAITSICQQARELRLPLALAGKISIDDLDWLCTLEPDIIGVRSAVCLEGQRGLSIDQTAIEAFRQALFNAADGQESISAQPDMSAQFDGLSRIKLQT